MDRAVNMKVLMPLPSTDFDPSETSVPWKELLQAGHHVVFATPDGMPGKADERMLNGTGLGFFKGALMARKDAIEYYQEMERSGEFNAPLKYDDLKEKDFDALFLPGGHAPGMKTYLESGKLKSLVVEFFNQKKVVAAICHGTLLVARSLDPKTGKSVLYGRKTTGLNTAQEFFAWRLTRRKLGDYYRTYPTPLEIEVRSYLADPKNDYYHGPRNFFLGIPTVRDSKENMKAGFVVKDGNYLSARWPGDVYAFSRELLHLLS